MYLMRCFVALVVVNGGEELIFLCASYSTKLRSSHNLAKRQNTVRRCHYNLRKYSFSMKITNLWNSLPFSVVTAPSVNSFKTDWINTGHYKTLNRIGKQNYQEPGVEAELNFEFFESFHFIF